MRPIRKTNNVFECFGNNQVNGFGDLPQRYRLPRRAEKSTLKVLFCGPDLTTFRNYM